MTSHLNRRDFMKLAFGGCALCAGCGRAPGGSGLPGLAPCVLSPGCRGTKVRVARIYMGVPAALWPKPALELPEEVRRYEAAFAGRPRDFADIDFVGNEIVSSPEQARQVREKLGEVDGILLIHLSMGTLPVVREFLAAGKPTIVFATPYSGHEWTSFGALTKTPEGRLLDCELNSDLGELAACVRPFRAIHHLREAKLINVTAKAMNEKIVAFIKDKFGTQIVQVGKEPVLAAYESIPEGAAAEETRRWIQAAERIVEPTRDEIHRSCRLALAFEKMLDAEKATAITVDCYGTMYRQLPAFPCIGHVRLNGMGLAGICESDLRTAITSLALQALTGKPGFISDPTVDISKNGIILAHCLGTPKMDGPDGPAARFRLRSIMERRAGAVPQVFMRRGQRVTQAELVEDDQLLYFTGTIIDAPDTDRGCRTQITVRVDRNADDLWRNWSHGLHRVTVYGDVAKDLGRFCRFKGIRMTDESARA